MCCKDYTTPLPCLQGRARQGKAGQGRAGQRWHPFLILLNYLFNYWLSAEALLAHVLSSLKCTYNSIRVMGQGSVFVIVKVERKEMKINCLWVAGF